MAAPNLSCREISSRDDLGGVIGLDAPPGLARISSYWEKDWVRSSGGLPFDVPYKETGDKKREN